MVASRVFEFKFGSGHILVACAKSTNTHCSQVAALGWTRIAGIVAAFSVPSRRRILRESSLSLAQKRVGFDDALCCYHTNRRAVMEDQLWKGILRLLKRIHKPRRRAREKFCCEEVVRVWLWAVLHDRPISWATCKANWPIHERRRTLPSSSTMCRRLRSREVVALLAALEEVLCRSHG